MTLAFYLASAVAIVATFFVITRTRAVHALLYLIVSLLAVAVVFYTLGAPFVAAIEVITYAGAIMVLFVFVIMMLNLGGPAIEQERRWLTARAWLGPAALSLVLLALLLFAVIGRGGPAAEAAVIGPREVGRSLFGPYLLGVELASLVLLSGLVGAYHLGRRDQETPESEGR